MYVTYVDKFGNICDFSVCNVKWRVVKDPSSSFCTLYEIVAEDNGTYTETLVLTDVEFNVWRHILTHSYKQQTVRDFLCYDKEIANVLQNSNYFRVARLLGDVSQYKLYEDYGYNSFKDFVCKCLNRSQTWGAMYAFIGKYYLDEDGIWTVFAKDGEDFDIGQLIRLYPRSPEVITFLLSSDLISLKTSCNDITKILAKLKQESK